MANDHDHSPAWIHAGPVGAMCNGRRLDEHQQFLLSLVQHGGMSENRISLVGDDMRIRFALSQLAAMHAGWTRMSTAAADLIRGAPIVRCYLPVINIPRPGHDQRTRLIFTWRC